MANFSWPEELPKTPFSDGVPDYKPTDNTIRTSTGAGPHKLRRRFTAVPEDVTLQLILTEDQMQVLFDFAKSSLGEVGPFDWVDFRTGNPATYRFKAGYSSIKQKWFAGDMWTIDIDLELLP